LKGRIVSTFTISPSSPLSNRPLHLHRADISSKAGSNVVAVLSVAKKGSNTSESQDPQDTDQPKLGVANSRLKIPSTTTFQYFQLRLPRDESGATELEPEWIVKGGDLPAFVQFDAESERYAVASSSPLTSTETAPLPTQLPQTAIDKEMTQLEGTDPSHLPSDSQSIPKPPPFSWTQDKESLTVAFPIPSSTPTSSIRITFSRLYLTLHIASPSAAISNSIPNFALPRISHKKWWGEVDPHTSVWTFDREAEGRDSNFGILTLHLEKQHAGTKWSDVFATSSRPDSNGGAKIEELNEEWEYEEVEETVDPSELAKISEDMEKWTRGIMEGGASQSNEGLGHGVPTSLMGDEMDVEVDAETGRSIVVSWIEGAGQKQEPKIITPHASLPYSLLSTPLPFAPATPTLSSFDSSITIKHDVDGLLFQPPSSTASKPYQWAHASTFPALAFVLATKRDTRFVYHHLDKFALAFDSPALLPSSSSSSSTTKSRDGAGNLFVYFTPEPKENKGKQMVLRVGDGASGSIMGVAGVELEGGELVIVALCELRLVVLKLQ